MHQGVTRCATIVSLSGGFPGGAQVDGNDQLYVNNQSGTLTSYDCSSLTSCTPTGSFTYSNGSNPLDYTAIALDPLAKNTLWGANIFFGRDSCSSGIANDAQPQSVPVGTSTLGVATAGWDNAEALGVARFKPDTHNLGREVYMERADAMRRLFSYPEGDLTTIGPRNISVVLCRPDQPSAYGPMSDDSGADWG